MPETQKKITEEDMERQIKEEAEAGVPIEISTKQLYDSGLTITRSIKVIKRAYRITLSEAKERVSNHSVWTSVVSAARPLHKSLEDAFGDEFN